MRTELSFSTIVSHWNRILIEKSLFLQVRCSDASETPRRDRRRSREAATRLTRACRSDICCCGCPCTSSPPSRGRPRTAEEALPDCKYADCSRSVSWFHLFDLLIIVFNSFTCLMLYHRLIYGDRSTTRPLTILSRSMIIAASIRRMTSS